MKVLAFLNPLPSGARLDMLRQCLGVAWVENIQWTDCQLNPLKIIDLIQDEQPDIVIALGREASVLLPRIKQALAVPFTLLRFRHPWLYQGDYPVYRNVRFLVELRVRLDMELNIREGSGAIK